MAEPIAAGSYIVTVRIVIVDDHPLAREGLKAVLSIGEFLVVAEAETGEEVVAVVAEQRPDIVLMDVRLGTGIDGLEATRRIIALNLDTRVVMLSLHEMPTYVREAIAAGAAGYVLKDSSIDDLRAAIGQVMAGHSVIPLGLASAAMRGVHKGTRSIDMVASLTERERQVLNLVAEGLTNKSIARALGISPATVKSHVERIIAKLGVTDRTQAAVMAAQARALNDPSES